MVIAGEGIFRDNEGWLSRARATPSCFSGWNHSASAAPDHSIRLNILANAAPDYPIRFGVLAMGEKLPQRGFTFDSPGLPTIGGYLGNDASKNATPLGVVLSFCINQTAFIGVDHANKKGGYLLSRIVLFDKVYHRTDWGVEGKQKKHSEEMNLQSAS